MFNPVILIFLFPALLAALVVFDRLVRIEYTEHRLSWEADGKPYGFFWVPAESKMAGGWLVSFGGGFARNRCIFGWLFSTPEWMRRDERALRLVSWLRVLVLSWNVGILGAVVAHLFF